MSEQEKGEIQSRLVSKGGAPVNFGMTIEDIDPDAVDPQYIDDKPVIPEDVPVVPSEPKVVSEAGDEDDDNQPEEQVDAYNDYSYAAVTALSFKQDGLLPESFKIEKELTGRQLKEYVINSWGAEQQAAFESNHDPEVVEFLKFVNKGGDINEVAKALQNRKYSNLDIEGEGDGAVVNKKAIIEARYKHMGMSDARLTSTINSIFQEDELDGIDDAEVNQEAKEALTYFKTIEQEELRSKQETLDAQIQARESAEEDTNRRIKQTIKVGKIGNYTINEKEQTALNEFIFSPTEIVRYVNQNGKTVTSRVPGFTKALEVLKTDVEKQLILAKLLMDGFDLQGLKQQGRREMSEDILDKLNGRTKDPVHVAEEIQKPQSTLVSRRVGHYRPRY